MAAFRMNGSGIHERLHRADLEPSTPAAPAQALAGTSAPPADCVVTCDTAAGLADIEKPDVELVIWRRSLPVRLESWLERLEAARLPDLRVLVEPRDLWGAIEPRMDDFRMPKGAMRDLLISDIDDLVSAFSTITRTGLVDVRLERVSDDACWKFHRDCVEARLLTTYRGPTTEWVQPHHAAQALHEQKLFKGPVEHLRQHDVAVFKGNCAGPESGIVHRSPPVAGTGHSRLLLCLNKPTAASPEPWPKGT